MEYQFMSLSDQIFEILEKDIILGAYPRGEILTESRLCEKLGVSRTPVREALKRLSQEHLLELTAKGARVIGVSIGDIEDIFEIRLRLEGLAAAKTTLHADEEGINTLRSILDMQEFYTVKGDAAQIQLMDSRFHSAIYRLSGSVPLMYTLEPLHRRITKYRQLSVTYSSRAEQSFREHSEVFKAVCERDAAAAEACMTRHIAAAKAKILTEGIFFDAPNDDAQKGV